MENKKLKFDTAIMFIFCETIEISIVGQIFIIDILFQDDFKIGETLLNNWRTVVTLILRQR